MLACAACVGLVATAGALEGQVTEQRLTEPAASFPHELSTIGGVMELPDGRLLLPDPLGQVLLALDLAAGTADTIGREGRGPEEYRQPDAVYPLPGDSTLLVDLGNGRLTSLGPDLSFGETAPIADGSPMSGNMVIRMPQAVDSEGRVYFQQMMGRMRPDGETADSAPVLRWDRSSGAIETIVNVKLEEVNVRRGGGPNNQQVDMSPVPMSPRDGWAAGFDGRVAVVRAGVYRVDWINADGTVVSGPVVDYEPVRIRNADKEAYLDEMASAGMQVQVMNENGRITTAFSRGGGRSSQRQLDSYDWPDVMPAFRANRVRVSPEGMVWVQRYTSFGEETAIDVFDKDGQLTKRVFLPVGRRLVGFGDGVLYAAYADDLDLQWLEMYQR